VVDETARLLERRERVRARLEDAGVDALLVTRAPNVRYLAGFTGSYGALLLLPDRDVFLTDRRYEDQAGWQVPGVEVSSSPADLIGGARRAGGERLRLGFEPAGLTWLDGQRLLEAMPRALPVPPLVEVVREVKDEGELATMRAAAAAGDAALEELLGWLRPGVTERETAVELERLLRRMGGDGLAFPSIVAFGEHAAEPHHHPSDRPLGRGDLVKLDFGATVEGYCSDMTRTFVLGPSTARQEELYALVQRSQASGLAVLRGGVTGGEIDLACRGVIERAGLGEAFSHPTGHGVGLEIHEAPRVRSGADGSIAASTPLTVEPGVYLPGFGGIRIEDLAVVRADGHELLTTAPKDLLVL
jgi:Xaa-Pro aminopeptidase